MTGERGKTTLSILSNVSDEDLSVVGGNVGQSQGQIDCWKYNVASASRLCNQVAPCIGRAILVGASSVVETAVVDASVVGAMVVAVSVV